MKIRKAILTGGGRATRLHPITTTINKHLLPLANKPMIFHAIEKVVEAGINQIFINTNPGETELQKYVGDGGYWGVNITFFEQVGGPQGIAHVVKQAEKFIKDEPFMFYLSDNIFLGSIKTMVEEFNAGEHDCMLALSKVKDPERFGVPVFDKNNKLVDVLEKPTVPPNDFAVTGIYLYGSRLFFQVYEKISKSERGEYEISSIHSHLLKNGHVVGYNEITGWWKDTGKPDDLLIANRLLLRNMQYRPINENLSAEANSSVRGKVQIGAGAHIGSNVKIVGPSIVGANCRLENCRVGPNVTVGQGSVVINCSVTDSIILENCHIECGIKISGSLIGKGVNIKKAPQQSAENRRMIIGDKTLLEL